MSVPVTAENEGDACACGHLRCYHFDEPDEGEESGCQIRGCECKAFNSTMSAYSKGWWVGFACALLALFVGELARQLFG